LRLSAAEHVDADQFIMMIAAMLQAMSKQGLRSASASGCGCGYDMIW
jgi:hypothetical protein